MGKEEFLNIVHALPCIVINIIISQTCIILSGSLAGLSMVMGMCNREGLHCNMDWEEGR